MFSGRIAITAIGFVFTPILVRLISKEQYGIYATILAAFSIISLISRGGMFDATRKFVAENQSGKQQSRIISTAIVLSLAYVTITLIVFWLILQTGIVPKQYSSYVPVLTVGLVFINIFSVMRGAFYGLHTEYTTELLGVIQKFTYAILAIVFLLLGGGLFGVFSGYSASFVITTVIGFFVLINTFHLEIPNKDAFRDYRKELFGYGTTQLVGGLSALLLYKTDILLVDYFWSSTDTAVYRAALLPAEYVWLIPSVIQMVFLQFTADLWSQNDISAINDQLATGVKYAILSLSLFGIGLFPLSGAFLGVYFGEQYIQGYVALQILLCGTILFGISRVIIPVFQATGWIKYTESLSFITLVLNVILNLLLIPHYGIIGAAIGTSASYSFILVWAIVIWNRSKFNFPEPILVRKWIVPQVGYAIIYVPTVYILDIGNIGSILVFPVFGLLMFVILNQLFGVINIFDAHKSIFNLF